MKHVCADCEDAIIGEVYKSLEDESLCEDCFEQRNLTTCPNCDEVFDCDDRVENPDGKFWCANCIEEECFCCNDCEELAWNSDCVEVSTGRRFDSLCESCASSNTVNCNDCSETVYSDNSFQTANGDVICESCYDAHYITCEECGEIVHFDDSYENDGYYCADCRPYGGNFDPSGFNNRSGCNDKIKSNRRFGVELETNSCEGYTDLSCSGAWGAKNDPTVSGKEFYSDILNGDAGLDAIVELCDLARKNNWDAGRNAGFHLHLDMRDESRDSLFAISLAYYLTEKVWFSFVAAHRHSNTYSRAIQWNCADLDATVTGEHSFCNFADEGTRYIWCNLVAYTQHTTIEIRLHHGTIDKEEVCNWIKAHTRFADWAAKLGYEGIKEKFAGLNNDEKFELMGREIWCDDELMDYYSEKARHYDHGYLESSIGLETVSAI